VEIRSTSHRESRGFGEGERRERQGSTMGGSQNSHFDRELSVSLTPDKSHGYNSFPDVRAAAAPQPHGQPGVWVFGTEVLLPYLRA
jgi:hypothetical protein